MISVDDALARVFDLVQPLDTETLPLHQAAGRYMPHPALATRATTWESIAEGSSSA